MSKPMTLNEIAIDDEMNQMRDRIQRLIRERDEARADNARLTARVAELEAMTIVLDGNDGDGLAAINRLYAACERGDIVQQCAPDIQAARAEIIASRNQSTTLTPRNCDTCKRAAEAMREAAASFA